MERIRFAQRGDGPRVRLSDILADEFPADNLNEIRRNITDRHDPTAFIFQHAYVDPTGQLSQFFFEDAVRAITLILMGRKLIAVVSAAPDAPTSAAV